MKSIVYPLKIANGKILTTEDYPRIVGQTILAVLKTRTDERVWRPDFGLEELAFSSTANVAAILAQVEAAIALGLTSDFPNVEVSVLGAIADDGRLDLLIRYSAPDFDPQTLELTV